MAQYFAILLVLCTSGASLGVTTTPQNPNTTALKGLCEKLITGHCFPGIPGANGIPGIPGVPGPQGPLGREGAIGETGDKGTRGLRGVRGVRGLKGLPGQNGSPGVKGEPGLMGIQGRKGDKGDKGESGLASAVPQTNWKQCVTRTSYATDNGKITSCSFIKLQSNTALKVSFQGNMRVIGTVKCNRWYFKLNGNECSGPMTIEAVVYNSWPSGSPNLLHHRSFEGYCTNIPQGAVTVELWVGKCPSYSLGDAYTGWNSVSRIIIEEVSRPQS